jgi:hypothetical protein
METTKSTPLGISQKDMDVLRQDTNSILAKLRLMRQFPDVIKRDEVKKEEEENHTAVVDCPC